VDSQEPSMSEDFAKRMVPFYAQCLIEVSFLVLDWWTHDPHISMLQNSVQGRLSVYAFDGLPDGTYSLAWYCVQLIPDKLRDLTSPAHEVKEKGEARDDVEDRSVERVHRLHLVPISMVSSLPVSLMSRVLEEIRNTFTAQPSDFDAMAEESARRRKELVEALFSEFLEGVGDREKEAAIRWWFQHRPMLISGEKGKEEGKGTIG